jgi:hypothetical protein
MSIETSRSVYRKMLLLQMEVTAANDLGPRGQLADVLTGMDVEIVMWDASQLARELLPEISLHYSRIQARGESQIHILRYVVVRPDNERIKLSEQALESWLMDNVGVQREMQLESAAQSIRKAVSALKPEAQKRCRRHLTLLLKELLLANA